MKSKIFGINLISLIIGSALGAFILSVIVRVSFTISNNYQIMKANAELATSARALHNFFMQAFAANGYIENNDITNTKYNGNAYTVFDGSNETRFYLWYSAGINGSLWCSGQPAAPIPPSSTSPSPPNTPWFLRVSLSSNISGTVSNPTKCKDKTLAMATGIAELDLPPIVSPQQFYDFSLVAIADAAPNIVNIKIISSNLSTTLTPYGYNRGIKLAILLRSAKQVFNKERSVSFNVFGTNVAKTAMSQLTTPTDKYLYKLVVIQSPFFYPAQNFINNVRISGNSINTVTQKCPSSGGSTCGGYVDSTY